MLRHQFEYMEMGNFSYDVFLSHSNQDKPVVRKFARELRRRGLIVWFDEWSILPGADIYLAIERGLQESRVQFLFLSTAALDSDWVSLERSTASFRDPANNAKSLIPVLISKCSLPDTLRRLKYVDATKITRRTIQYLMKALPDDIRDKVSQREAAENQWILDEDGEEYELIQVDGELNRISSRGLHNSDLDEELIDRLSEKIVIFNNLENMKSSAALSPVFMYFVDIDGFTFINEKYGHFVGNQILKIVEKLTRSVFEGHNVAYWSADEFVVCSSGLYDSDPINRSQNLCNAIRKFRWEKITPGLFVTISIGIAKYRGDPSDNCEKTVDWFERAIIGSFEAKKNGGNQPKIGPELGYRARPKQNRFVRNTDVHRDYQYPKPEIRFLSLQTS